MNNDLPILVGAPYDEGAVMALVRYISETVPGRATVLVRAKPWDALLRTMSFDRSVSAHQSRTGLPVAAVSAIAPVSELLRVATFAVTTSGIARRTAMDYAARRFDTGTSRRIDRAAAVVGMPVACARTFAANSSLGGTNIYHAVNSHPRFQNAVLRDVYPARLLTRELIPDSALRTVDAETSSADVLLSPSAITTRSYSDAQDGRPPSTIEVPYAVDLELFRPAPLEGTTRSTDRPVKLVFVGQISYRKGLPILKRAMAEVTGPVSLEMYGPVVAPELLDRLPDSMHYRGMIGHDRLAQVFNDADAFVLPSLEDAFGLVVSEAAASGLPIITTKETGAAAYLPLPDHYVLPALDHRALRDAIDSIRPLTGDRREELAASFRGCAAGFGWPEYAARVLRGIDDAVKTQPTR